MGPTSRRFQMDSRDLSNSKISLNENTTPYKKINHKINGVMEIFKNKVLTFEEINAMSARAFENPKLKNDAEFRPSDILDLDQQDDSESDEILSKFNKKK